jgi:hypothetical protein
MRNTPVVVTGFGPASEARFGSGVSDCRSIASCFG